MAYIREKTSEITGYQEHTPFAPSIDLQCDFVMVYGIDRDMPERVKTFKEKGYVVHLMTGVAWGEYQDYLNGEFDGRKHWDEGQTDRNGKGIIHNPTVPYMVPTISFSDYLTEKLKAAVDAGVEAIHIEEPEFWDAGGYSESFKREYEIYYKEKWQPPHLSLDLRYKASKLKAYLYKRAISRISASLKEYAMVSYNKPLRFYVPTHSLLNYTQWKIMSPEAALIDIPTVDGCIAQIWTGTSREANVYEGVYKERTFETAYLEYGIMQELVKGTGRKIWFLHDPIEDNPSYTWENYRYNYIKTVVASLLHPEVASYEICPWPHRVFDGIYPRVQPNIAQKDERSVPSDDSKPIPQEYSTLLSSMIQLLGDMEQKDCHFESVSSGVGILMADSGLFQRTFPDGIVENGGIARELADCRYANYEKAEETEAGRKLMEKISAGGEALCDFIQSGAFPNFFGMALPLLKHGLPVRPVQLDNIKRFTGYLDDYANLILSYEYIKPESPDINSTLALWVKSGGTLIYIGDGRDPYHCIDSWWQKAKYNNPAEHLFEILGLPREVKDGIYSCEKGTVGVMKKTPALLCLNAEEAGEYRSFVKKVLQRNSVAWEYSNDITLHRGPYIISCVMDESGFETPKTFGGLYADMIENDYKIITEKEIGPDENTILFDFSKIEDEKLRVIGSSARVLSMEVTDGLRLRLKTADRIKAFTRIRVPQKVISAEAVDRNGETVAISCDYDERTRTVLLAYDSKGEEVSVKCRFED